MHLGLTEGCAAPLNQQQGAGAGSDHSAEGWASAPEALAQTKIQTRGHAVSSMQGHKLASV